MDDLGKAFTYPFRDPSWVKKFLLAALFMILSVFILGIFILAGYFVQVIQRVVRREENPMPEWEDIGVKLIVGFKFCVVYFIYLLPILFLMIPVFVLSIIGIFSESATVGLLSSVYTMLILFVIIPYSLAIALCQPIISSRFAVNERIAEALDIGAILQTFKRNWQHTLIVALIATGIQSFAGIGIIFFIIGVFATLFYSYLVTAYMYGNLYLEQTQEGLTTQ